MSIFIGLLTFVSCSSSEDVKNKTIEQMRQIFPKYEEVLIFLSKSIDRGGKDCRFEVAKKAEGYFLLIYANEGDYELLNEQKVWDFQSQKFSKPKVEEFLKDYTSYFKDKSFSEEEMKKRLSTIDAAGFKGLYSRAKSFDFNLFYGYQGWAQDVIDVIEPIEATSNLEKELLARAYDNLASDYIHPGQYGHRADFSKDFKKSIYQKIDQARIDKFLVLAQKSLEYYDQIVDNDPNYESFLIGNVQLKRANNYMHYWLLLRSVLENELADQFIKEAKFREGDIETAKIYLTNCSKNALIISNGDSDTYPLWFVQEVLGFRKDLKVINSSLLAAPWYPRMIVAEMGLESVIDESNYRNTKLAYILFNGTDNNRIKVTELLSEVKSKTENLNEVMLNLPFSPKLSLEFDSSIVDLSISPSYLFVNELLLLDLIQSNSSLEVYASNRGAFKKFGLDKRFYEGLLLSKLDIRSGGQVKFNERFDLLDGNDFDLLFEEGLNLNENSGRLILTQYYQYLASLKSDRKEEKTKELKRFNSRFKPSQFFNREDMAVLNIVILIAIQSEEEGQKEDVKNLLKFLNEVRIEIENDPEAIDDNIYHLGEVYNIYRALQFSENKNARIDKAVLVLKGTIVNLRKDSEMKGLKWTVEKLDRILKNIDASFPKKH